MTQPVPYEKPKDLNSAIALYWQEQQALAFYKDRERQAREWLADLLCAADDDYVNKTVQLGEGWRLKMDVKRELRVDKNDERYKMLPSMMVSGSDFSATEFGAFCKITQVIKHNMTGYRQLPQRIKDYLGSAAQETNTVSIKFEPPKDDR